MKNLIDVHVHIAAFPNGTDYPLSAYATPFLGRVSPATQWKLWRTKSIFDKQAMVLEALGVCFNEQTTKRLLRLA